MIRTGVRWSAFFVLVTVTAFLATGPRLARSAPAAYNGNPLRIGHGTAHTVVRTQADGTLASIGVMFTAGMLDGLPTSATGAVPDDGYLLPMPAAGPRTVVDHVVINWEPAGHPPPHVYDVPHFDFHFYLVSEADQHRVVFKDEKESGDASQQPLAGLLPARYVVPPGTAVSRMGVHAIDPSGPEFRGQPFTATFIYGFYDGRQTFLEPMASLAFLRSKPSFSAPVTRPASYTKPGVYPSAYGITYDAAHDVYEVRLVDFK